MLRARYVGQSAMFEGEVLDVDLSCRNDSGRVVGTWTGRVRIPMVACDLVLERGPHMDATDEATYRAMMRRLARTEGRDLA
jgi:hypothetical protein